MSHLPIPQTPRGHTRTGLGATPLFSFGLGFLPSFNFNLPRNVNLLNTFLPQRFFQTSSELLKVVKDDKDVFHLLTPPNSSKPNDNKFLDVLKKLAKSDDEIDSDDLDLWSITNESNTMNLTSVCEKDFLTPNKILKTSPNTSSIPLKRKADLPSKAIASQIDTIASPVKQRKVSSTVPNQGWTADLDEALMKSYAKFKVFKDNQLIDSLLTLKNTSQNRILSRMIYNKTKVSMTSQQVATRLSELTSTPHEHDDATPMSQLTALNSAIDKELGHLFGSTLRQLEVAFEYKSGSKHVFTRLAHTSSVSMSEATFKKRFSVDIVHTLLPQIRHTTLWHVSTGWDLGSKNDTFNAQEGDFSSCLSIDVPVECDEPILLWRCSTFVYQNNRLLFASQDFINGYKNDVGFSVQIPFLKKFWAGYLAYLVNGLSKDQLVVVQVIHAAGTLDAIDNVSHCIVHDFVSRTPGASTVATVTLGEDDDDDDNATVLANLSPYQVANSPASAQRSLRIDINKANENRASGPASAPIYNAQVVNKVYQVPKPRKSEVRQDASPFLVTSTPALNWSTPQHDGVLDHMPEMMHNPMAAPPPNHQYLMMLQQQQHMQMQMQMAQQPVVTNHHQQQMQMMQRFTPHRPFIQYSQPLSSAPASQTQFAPNVMPTPMKPDKENVRPAGAMQIKFGPIIGYDPSKNKKSKRDKGINVYRVPMSPHMSVYQPDRK